MNVGTPILSIITVVKDDFDGINETYHSIKELLDYEVIEWVIVDGSSDDITQNHFFDKKNNITYQRSFDGGIYPAMQTALSYCRGMYVWFLNAKDTNLLSFNQLDQVFQLEGFPSIIKFNARVPQHGYQKDKERLGFSYLIRHTFNHQSYFLKLDKAKEFPFNPKLKLAGDYHQLLNLWATYSSVLYINMDIVDYDMTGATVGSSTNNQIRLERLQSSWDVAKKTMSLFVMLIFLLQIVIYSAYLLTFFLKIKRKSLN